MFKPYAGVSTAILIFTKGGTHDRRVVLRRGGGRLHAGRQARPDRTTNDLPDVRESVGPSGTRRRTPTARQSVLRPKARDCRATSYDLSINRYKEIVHEEVKYDPPKTILKRLKKMEAEIAKDLDELEAMLG